MIHAKKYRWIDLYGYYGLACPKCGAKANSRCIGRWRRRLGWDDWHVEREKWFESVVESSYPEWFNMELSE
jgi:hypothetical protein